MFSRRAHLCLAAFIFTLTVAPCLYAQAGVSVLKPAPTPTPAAREEQDQVTIFTEEVRLPVVAFDDYGHFDPSLEMDDVLVLEDGVLQPIRSVRRVPANVLLLLDTGSEMTLAKSLSTTREIAMRLLANLHAPDQVAIMQFNNRVELLQDWTTDREGAQRVLKTKLFSDKRGGRLADAITKAAAQLKDRPAGGRHVVIITDGVESSGNKVIYADAVKELIAAQATVHVISYTALVRQAVEKRYPNSIFRAGGKNPPRDATPGGDPTMPPGQTRNPSYGILTIDTDAKMRRRFRDYAKATKVSEQRLKTLAEDTGGQILLPTTTAEMISQGEDVARDIGAQYVIAYTPKRALAAAPAGEFRRIEVTSRRGGLHLRSRRGYIVAR